MVIPHPGGAAGTVPGGLRAGGAGRPRAWRRGPAGGGRFPPGRGRRRIGDATGRESSVTGRCGNLDGEITSRCAADALPEKDGECNFTGADGWQRGPEEGTVEVHMDDGTWQVFSLQAP